MGTPTSCYTFLQTAGSISVCVSDQPLQSPGYAPSEVVCPTAAVAEQHPQDSPPRPVNEAEETDAATSDLVHLNRSCAACSVM